MATHKPFRELIKPGTNFEFVGRARLCMLISFLLIAGSVGMLFINKSWRGDYMNWSTDFKGGTELIFEFCEPKTNDHVEVDPGRVRSALSAAGYDGFEVSDFTWQGYARCSKVEGGSEGEDLGEERSVTGMLVRTRDFGALDDDTAERLRLGFVAHMEKACLASSEAAEKKWTAKDCAIESAGWSGDRLFVTSRHPIDEKEVRAFFTASELSVKPGDQGYASTKEEGIEEFRTEITVSGLDKQYAAAIDKGLEGAVARVVQSYGVGAKAGEQLRNDGIQSLVFAMALIMLYLAFRFDVRYAPGAVVALLHNAIIVVGVFAVTWTEFSLVSVAALLTVIGYSVNDTVVIFDRIREDADRLKDKKLDRIVNIAINETLGRSLLTGVTVLSATLMMNIFGVGLVANFAFAMNIGVVVGTYSSIFIAAPIFLWIDRRFYPPTGPAKPGDKARLKKDEDEPEEPEEPDEDDGEEPAAAAG